MSWRVAHSAPAEQMAEGEDERCGRGPGTLTPSLWRTLHDGSLRCFLEALLPVFDPRSHYLAQDSL